jgi:hypothetical protein
MDIETSDDYLDNPWLPVLENKFIGVEHPFKVKNDSKAIESLGGNARIAKVS